MKLSENRACSFFIVFLVYGLATASGILSYHYFPFAPYISLLLADILATVLTFAFSVALGNASVYDPYWSVQPLVIVLAFALRAPALGWLQILCIVTVFIWGVRLTANWAYTFRSLKHQDWRYTMLREKTKALYPFVNFLGIHLVPTLIVYGCTLPAVFLITSGATHPASAPFFALSLCAVLLQGTADCQMHAFRKKGTGSFIRVGVWKYSRHPNYLGEILMWWGVAIACVIAMPAKWYLCAGALMNTLLFLFVSIPLADNRQARKPDFAAYKAQTRMLLPIKKRPPARKVED